MRFACGFDIVGIFCSHIMAAIGLDDQEEEPVRGG